MKNISMFVGLLCLVAGQAPAETFQEQAALLPTPQGRPVADYEDLSQAMQCYWPKPVEGVVVIRDAETLQGLVGGDCVGADLPKIDFSQRTIIGLYTAGGGCSIEFKRTVSRDDAAKKIVLSVVVLSEGECEKMGMSMNWVSVPVIPEDYEVTGKIAGEAQEIRPASAVTQEPAGVTVSAERQESLGLDEVRRRIPGRFFECSAKGRSSTLHPDDHRAVVDLQDAKILLLLKDNTREFRWTLADFSSLPGNKAYVRFGGPDTRGTALITVGAQELFLAPERESKQGAILLSTAQDNVTETVGGPAKCTIRGR